MTGPLPGLRVGQGYDIHRLVPGRALVLGGVTLPWDVGLEGHSDGDAVCHAVADAILGAAGLGDIGAHFPSEDPRWKDASSIALLGGLAGMIDDAGYGVHNLDVTVILQVPKLAAYKEPMAAALAEALRIDVSRVSVKAKTTDGIGVVGTGEAIAALAVVLLGPRDGG